MNYGFIMDAGFESSIGYSSAYRDRLNAFAALGGKCTAYMEHYVFDFTRDEVALLSPHLTAVEEYLQEHNACYVQTKQKIKQLNAEKSEKLREPLAAFRKGVKVIKLKKQELKAEQKKVYSFWNWMAYIFSLGCYNPFKTEKIDSLTLDITEQSRENASLQRSYRGIEDDYLEQIRESRTIIDRLLKGAPKVQNDIKFASYRFAFNAKTHLLIAAAKDEGRSSEVIEKRRAFLEGIMLGCRQLMGRKKTRDVRNSLNEFLRSGSAPRRREVTSDEIVEISSVISEEGPIYPPKTARELADEAAHDRDCAASHGDWKNA